MNAADILMIIGGLGLIAGLAWYFFAPRKATQAQVSGGVQTVDITVRGGYSPNLVRVTTGTPVRLRFDRQDNSDCTPRVVFPDFRKSASLAPFATTTLDLTVDEPGEYAWACGMNMLHGTLVADPPPGASDGNAAGGSDVADRGESRSAPATCSESARATRSRSTARSSTAPPPLLLGEGHQRGRPERAQRGQPSQSPGVGDRRPSIGWAPAARRACSRS